MTPRKVFEEKPGTITLPIFLTDLMKLGCLPSEEKLF